MPVAWHPYPNTSGTGSGTDTWTLSTSSNVTITMSSASTVYYAPTVWTSSVGTIRVEDLNPVITTYEEISEEDQARFAEQRQVQEAQAEERRQAHVSAVDRATQLLLSILNEVQAASYLQDRMFEVVGSHGGLYRIRPGSMANVDALDPVTRAVTGRLCAHPRLWDGGGHLPDPDVALAQLLDLTTDEPGFCRTANVHGGQRPAVAALAA